MTTNEDPTAAAIPEPSVAEAAGATETTATSGASSTAATERPNDHLRPRTGTRDEEVERVSALGATQLSDMRGHYGPGTGWVVFADPEGNEFCVLRSAGEVAQQEEAADA